MSALRNLSTFMKKFSIEKLFAKDMCIAPVEM